MFKLFFKDIFKRSKDRESAFEILELADTAYETSLKQKSFYVAIAYRWGNDEGHIFPIGLYLTLETAVASGLEHDKERGGKYYTRVFEANTDGKMDQVFDCGELDIQIVKLRRDQIDEITGNISTREHTETVRDTKVKVKKV